MISYYKNKFIINISTISIFFILIAIFIIYPVLIEISRVNNDITSERVKLERKLALGLNIKKIVKDLESIENTTYILDTIFINKGQELELVNQLETIADKHSIDIDINSDFIGEHIESNVFQVEIKTILTGNYSNIINFMEEIESLEKYFNTKTILISKNIKNENSSITAQLTSNIYLKK